MPEKRNVSKALRAYERKGSTANHVDAFHALLVAQEKEMMEMYTKKDNLLLLVNYEWIYQNNKKEYMCRLSGA